MFMCSCVLFFVLCCVLRTVHTEIKGPRQGVERPVNSPLSMCVGPVVLTSKLSAYLFCPGFFWGFRVCYCSFYCWCCCFCFECCYVVVVVVVFSAICRFYWEWLPAFAGVHGRINELSGGENMFTDSVFIGGEFNPPVLVWTNDPEVGPSTTSERLFGLWFALCLSLACF